MAEYEIYDYVSAVTPDYSATTLTLRPQGIIYEDGSKAIEIHEGRDGSEEAIILSDVSVFFIRLQWKAISASESGDIFDMYHDSTKACGIARSFPWQHPTDGHTYVVKFRDVLSRFKENAAIYGFSTLRLKVMGRIDD